VRASLLALQRLAEGQLAAGQFGAAAGSAAQVLAQAEALQLPDLVAHSHFLLGRAHSGQSEWAAAEQALGEALSSARSLGLRGLEWRSLGALSRVYRGRHKPQAAQDALSQASAVLEGLSRGLPDEATRQLFLAQPEVQSMLAPPAGPPGLADSPYPAGLTGREVEVLRLVASGLTNAQIGEKLIVSPLTVNAHLRSIYRKLDVTSRAAATRYALEHGLT
jgi:DNA-binding NarL/FixJ family response regulator